MVRRYIGRRGPATAAWRVMTYTVTIRTPQGASVEGQTSTFDVASEMEARRIAQDGALTAYRNSRFVTFEVHDRSGLLGVSYTSATVDS